MADHLEVVPGVVHEAAAEAVELLEGAQLLGERGHDRLELAPRGEGGGNAVEHLDAVGGRAELRVEAHVLQAVADLLAEGLQQLEVRGDAARVLQHDRPQLPLAGAQRRRGEPAPVGQLLGHRPPAIQRLPRELLGRAVPPVGEAELRPHCQLTVVAEHEGHAARERERADHVLQRRAQEPLLLTLHREVVHERHERPDRTVLGPGVHGGAACGSVAPTACVILAGGSRRPAGARRAPPAAFRRPRTGPRPRPPPRSAGPPRRAPPPCRGRVGVGRGRQG